MKSYPKLTFVISKCLKSKDNQVMRVILEDPGDVNGAPETSLLVTLLFHTGKGDVQEYPVLVGTFCRNKPDLHHINSYV